MRSPIRLHNCQPEGGKAPPALGDSTVAVLHEIGLAEEEIKALFNEGVAAKPG